MSLVSRPLFLCSSLPAPSHPGAASEVQVPLEAVQQCPLVKHASENKESCGGLATPALPAGSLVPGAVVPHPVLDSSRKLTFMSLGVVKITKYHGIVLKKVKYINHVEFSAC